MNAPVISKIYDAMLSNNLFNVKIIYYQKISFL